MKRVISILSLMFLVLIIFAACTDGSTEETTNLNVSIPEPSLSSNTAEVIGSNSSVIVDTQHSGEAELDSTEKSSGNNIETGLDSDENLSGTTSDVALENSDDSSEDVLEIVDEVVVDAPGDVVIGGN